MGNFLDGTEDMILTNISADSLDTKSKEAIEFICEYLGDVKILRCDQPSFTLWSSARVTIEVVTESVHPDSDRVHVMSYLDNILGSSKYDDYSSSIFIESKDNGLISCLGHTDKVYYFVGGADAL